jgi:hypothetical protein
MGLIQPCIELFKPNVKKLDSENAFNEINNPNIHVVIQALTPNLFIVSPKNHECGTIQTCIFWVSKS